MTFSSQSCNGNINRVDDILEEPGQESLHRGPGSGQRILASKRRYTYHHQSNCHKINYDQPFAPSGFPR